MSSHSSRKTRTLSPLGGPPSPASFSVHFTPKTRRQAEMVRLYQDHDVLLALGCAGTGKTITAVYCALRDVAERQRKEVVVLRPAVTCGEDLGFLPGELQEKLDPYKVPFHQAAAKVAFKVPESVIRFEALAFIRGVNYENCVVILDESQNCTTRQLKTFLTRLSHNAKLIILGDPEQSDIRPTQNEYASDLEFIADRLDGIPGCAIVDFEPSDSVRHPLVNRMLARLS